MTINLPKLNFNEDGLIPAIVQDANTDQVLMLAYMNQEALEQTIQTKETWFFSRSEQTLWHKGATSGNKQQVKQMSYDCDKDALLIQADPLGPACHTGAHSCFSRAMYTEESADRDVIHKLTENIHNRRQQPVEGSYTTYLFREGLDKILKKVGEETSEVIIGAKNADQAELTWEIADLTYHMLVLMEMTDVSIQDIKSELHKRHWQKAGSET